MSMLTCTEVRDVAPELALGVLGGADRAEALLHIDRCPACRAHVGELSEAADALTLLAPEAEPPAGFEDRVLHAMAAQRSRGWRRMSPSRWLVAAAILCVVAAGSTIGSIAAVRVIDGPHAEYAQQIHKIGGKSFRAASMVGAGNKMSGQAFAYSGKPSWVFVSIDYAVPTGTYEVVLDDANGTHRLGEMHVIGGQGTWGGAAPGSIANVQRIRLVDHNDQLQCEARFT
jgi:hypothetical protein